ncbi:MAG: SDR family NAD(P)-dependent oxidoreductase [Candidatus Azotimanducaceae bacterium]
MSKQQGELNLQRFKDQIAVITGAGNNGIGWGIAKHAALELGMHVVLVDLHLSVVEAACEKLRELATGQKIIGVQCDVTKIEELERVAQVLDEKIPNHPIGMVFANAGVIFNNTILKSSLEDWKITMNVNVLGVVATAKVFVPLLQRQTTESVFCSTASVGGLVRGDGGAASYQASKHAVVALSESLSFEIAKKSPQIRVCVLCPCIVTSSLLASSVINKKASKGESEVKLEQLRPASSTFAMTPENHAKQVFDLMKEGKFYLVTDNVRPYVEHDYPFEAKNIIRERFQNLDDLELDNSDVFDERGQGHPTSILKGAMFKEIRRLNELEG